MTKSTYFLAYLPEIFAVIGTITIAVYGSVRPRANHFALRVFGIAWSIGVLFQARLLLVLFWKFSGIPGLAAFGGGLLVDRFSEMFVILINAALIVIFMVADDLEERYHENTHWVIAGIVLLGGVADWGVQQGDMATTILAITTLGIISVLLFAGERAHEDVSDIIFRLSVQRFLGLCAVVIGSTMLVMVTGSSRISSLLSVSSPKDGLFISLGVALLVGGLSWNVLFPPLWATITSRSTTVSPTVQNANIILPLLMGAAILIRLFTGGEGDGSVVLSTLIEIIVTVMMLIAIVRLLAARNLIDMQHDLLILAVASVFSMLPDLNTFQASTGAYTSVLEGLACIALAYPMLNVVISRVGEHAGVHQIHDLSDLVRKDRWSTTVVVLGVILLVGVPPFVAAIPHLAALEIVTFGGAPWLAMLLAVGWSVMVIVAVRLLLAGIHVGEKDRNAVQWSGLAKGGSVGVLLLGISATVANGYLSHFLQSVAVFIR